MVKEELDTAVLLWISCQAFDSTGILGSIASRFALDIFPPTLCWSHRSFATELDSGGRLRCKLSQYMFLIFDDKVGIFRIVQYRPLQGLVQFIMRKFGTSPSKIFHTYITAYLSHLRPWELMCNSLVSPNSSALLLMPSSWWSTVGQSSFVYMSITLLKFPFECCLPINTTGSEDSFESNLITNTYVRPQKTVINFRIKKICYECTLNILEKQSTVSVSWT